MTLLITAEVKEGEWKYWREPTCASTEVVGLLPKAGIEEAPMFSGVGVVEERVLFP